jgi:hypothetical protein
VELEEEAIELRFRQRVRAFHLERVLRREDDERLIEDVGLLPDGDAVLLHGFEERALRLRRGAVDLVREDDVGENRPFAELERLVTLLRLVDDRRAEDVGGHEVGRELDAREVERERLGQRAHEHRLAETGHTFEQGVATGEHARGDAVDDLAVADDRLRDLLAQLADVVAELRDLRAHLPRIHRRIRHVTRLMEGERSEEK